MVKNVGSTDRVFRAAIGAALVSYAAATGVWWGWLGLIPLATAFTRWCPAYVPFKISTIKKTP